MSMDDILRRLSETNMVPNAKDVILFQQALQLEEKNIFDLEMRICQLVPILEELFLQRSNLLARIAAQKSAFEKVSSPIRRIPPEILAEIFLHYRPNLGTCIYPLSYRESPLPLTHVCYAWRQVALGLPMLWTDISFRDNPPSRYASRLVDIGRVWLSRTSILPVSATIEGLDVPQIARSIRLISEYASRFKTMKIKTTLPSVQLLLALLPLRTMESLEYLSLHNHTGQTSETFQILLTPNLRRFSLSNFPSTTFHDITKEMPWAQLTHLNLSTRLDLHTVHGILRQCLNLEECSVSIMDVVKKDPTPDLVLPKLRELFILGDYGYSAISFLGPLVLPSLSVLVFTGYVVKPSRKSVISLATRSSFRLTRFVALVVDPGILLNLSSALPSLLELDLASSSFDDYTLERFSNYKLFPKLQYLTLRDVTDNMTFRILQKIRSRCWPGPASSMMRNGVIVPRLKGLSFTLSTGERSEIPARVLEYIEQLEQEGLEITYRRWNESFTPPWL